MQVSYGIRHVFRMAGQALCLSLQPFLNPAARLDRTHRQLEELAIVFDRWRAGLRRGGCGLKPGTGLSGENRYQTEEDQVPVESRFHPRD